MCGIAGILTAPTASPVALEELRRMIAMLAHRGPDGHGLYRGPGIGLAHARLSLIDLAGGFQPLHNQDSSIWMVFNGEIFNYIELRRELAALGHQFYTDGDSEVIIHCYERYGPKAWTMLNGQFAFALWDGRTRRLWLVRDRLGILPLQYARVGERLLFASEAKALFAGGRLAPHIDPQALAETFSCWSATAPRTLFAGVAMVPPGSALCFDQGLTSSGGRYWHPDPTRQAQDGLSVEEAVDGLEHHLSRSVALRLRADVPVGCYISGGLDSSVIGGLAVGQVGDGLNTFGIRFADPVFDETPEQRRAVAALGTRHHEILCDGADIRRTLEEVVWHCETPLLRTSPVPLYLLAGLVRERGITTVLTGEGADELLAGYTIFKEDQIRRFWARRPDSAMRPALLGRIHHYVGSQDARSTALWRNFFRQGLMDTGHPFYSHLIRWRNTAWTLRLLAPEVGAAFNLETMLAEAENDLPADWRSWDPLTRSQVIEMRSFMSSYLLSCQGDRVAMAHGVEARYPFLDPNVVDFCLALPKRHKLLGLRDKLVLRRLAARRLPPEIWRRRKQPFRAPIGAALFGSATFHVFNDLMSPAALAGDGLIDPVAAGRLLDKAHRQDGVMGGEREDMGLVGLLTLRLLRRLFGEGFTARADAARALLDRSPLCVFADTVG
ncbi:MAG: asparagine synthase (glutamine-hydrolyzing) [Alphaproteobacteria bacterium]